MHVRSVHLRLKTVSSAQQETSVSSIIIPAKLVVIQPEGARTKQPCTPTAQECCAWTCLARYCSSYPLRSPAVCLKPISAGILPACMSVDSTPAELIHPSGSLEEHAPNRRKAIPQQRYHTSTSVGLHPCITDADPVGSSTGAGRLELFFN